MRSFSVSYLLLTVAIAGVMPSVAARAADFTVTNGQTVGAQALTGSNVGTVDAGGTISTAGANAVEISGAGNTLLNNGDITTSGNGHEAVNITGATTTVTNNGSISTSNTNATGIQVSGGATNNVITNNGTISITGDSGHGIWVATNGNTITNAGTITMSGSASANSIYAQSSNNTITNSGTISTSVGNIDGIFMLGNSNTATNSGNIITQAAGSDGMFANGSTNNLTNTGTISTAGANADAMYATGTGNTLVNRATISTTGSNGDGMYATGSSNSLTNYGNITTSNANADGMFLAGTTNNTATNYGRIVTSGSGYGIVNSANDAVIINHGYVEATAATATIRTTGTGTTVRLMANSTVIGDINFAAAGGILQYDFRNAAAVVGDSLITFDGSVTGTAPTTQVLRGSQAGNGAFISSGNNHLFVSDQTFVQEAAPVLSVSNQANNLVAQRQLYATVGKNIGVKDGTQYAANAATSNDANPGAAWGIGESRQFWMEGFGAYQERPEHGNSAYTEAWGGGVLTGVDLPVDHQGYRYGFYLGGFAGKQEIGQTRFRTVDSGGVMLGGYAGRQWGANYLGAQLSTGYAEHVSKRYVAGGIAKADYGSFFVSPSLIVSRPMRDVVSDVTLLPSLSVRYTAIHGGSYHETGSAANQNVDSRLQQTIGARAMLEAHVDNVRLGAGDFMPALRVGLDAETSVGDNAVDLTVLGNSLSLKPGGDRDTVDAIIGANFAYDLDNGPEIYLDGEAAIGMNNGGAKDNVGGTARAGLRWKL